MEEEEGGKIHNFYGSFTFHVKLCFKRHVHWSDGWKKEGNSIEEENLVKEKDIGILICSFLEPALALIGQTVHGQEVVGIRVVNVEHHDTSIGVDVGKEVIKEEELKTFQEEKCMPSETHVEFVVDSQDEEGTNWSEVAGQGSMGEIVASKSSIDGMALEKMKRHSHDEEDGNRLKYSSSMDDSRKDEADTQGRKIEDDDRPLDNSLEQSKDICFAESLQTERTSQVKAKRTTLDENPKFSYEGDENGLGEEEGHDDIRALDSNIARAQNNVPCVMLKFDCKESHEGKTQPNLFVVKHGLTKEDTGCLSYMADKKVLYIGQENVLKNLPVKELLDKENPPSGGKGNCYDGRFVKELVAPEQWQVEQQQQQSIVGCMNP